MTRLYTRTGDSGKTRLWDGSAVSKDDPRISLNGALDETSAALGLARALLPESLRPDILRIQHDLQGMMAFVARGSRAAAPPDAAALERRIDEICALCSPPCEFVFPGESESGGVLHLARCIARRAEREAVPLFRDDPQGKGALRYLNRLSDLLFALALLADREAQVVRIARRVLERLECNGDVDTASCKKREGKEMKVTLAVAKKLVAAMEEEASKVGVPMVIAVCDGSGELVALSRMDGALPVSVDLAPRKARTAFRIRIATADLAKLSQPGAPLYGIGADPEIVIFGGGIPLRSDGEIVGAVGVSGGTVEEDVRVAEAALGVW